MDNQEVKKITLSTILSWTLGIIFLLAGVAMLFTNFLVGIFSLLTGLVLLPATNNFLANKFKISLSGGLKFITVIVLLGLTVYFANKDTNLTGLDNESTDIKETNEENTQEEEVVEGSIEKPYQKTQKVTVGEVDWEIVSAENIGPVIYSGNPFIDDCKANSGNFVKLIVKVKNNRKELFTITDLTLVDNQGRKFLTSSDVSMCVGDTIFILDNINPGIEKTFTAIYEVPEDATGLMLEVDSTGSLFSGDANKYISLGL